jgi:hypothetical protein
MRTNLNGFVVARVAHARHFDGIEFKVGHGTYLGSPTVQYLPRRSNDIVHRSIHASEPTISALRKREEQADFNRVRLVCLLR